MSSLGQTFRELRKSKGLTLKEVADDQISVAVISKFENGASMLGLDRFLHLLNQINATTSEFFYWQTDRYAVKPSVVFGHSGHGAPGIKLLEPFYEIIELVNQAESKTARAKAVEQYQQRIQKATHEHPTQMNRQILAYANSSVDLLHYNLDQASHDILPVVHYLESVDQWGEFELFLLIFSLTFVDTDDLTRLFKRAMRRADWYQWLAEERYLRYNLCFDAFSVLVGKQHYDEARLVLEQMDTLVHSKSDSDMQFAVQALFMHGWLDIVTGAKEKGKQQCENALSVYRILNVSGDEDLLRPIYDHILKYDPSDKKHMMIMLTLD
ncbi:MAG TPA: hypothetical protein DCW31_10740 [Lactobacillus sp.]|nr:hypothetical protein [Lactobacillus sp.]